MSKSIRQIQADLEAIEQDDTLYEEANFGGRQRALEALEVSALQRMEGLLAAHCEANSLVALRGRAEAVQCRLEALDAGLFHKLREGIRSGILRATALRHQLEAYAGCGEAVKDQVPGTYDSLDALVSGILFAGAPPSSTANREPEMVFYQPTPARIIFELVENADLQKHDTFYDLGSGLGQVVILVHLLSGVTAKGVEVDPAYCKFATQSARDLSLSGVEFANADARVADYSSGTVFFLYTPFEGKMLQQVLDRLKGEAETRTIRVYTYGPCTFAVSRQSWLKPMGQRTHHVDRLAVFISVGGRGCG